MADKWWGGPIGIVGRQTDSVNNLNFADEPLSVEVYLQSVMDRILEDPAQIDMVLKRSGVSLIKSAEHLLRFVNSFANQDSAVDQVLAHPAARACIAFQPRSRIKLPLLPQAVRIKTRAMTNERDFIILVINGRFVLKIVVSCLLFLVVAQFDVRQALGSADQVPKLTE
jgi:hypothetical protein